MTKGGSTKEEEEEQEEEEADVAVLGATARCSITLF